MCQIPWTSYPDHSVSCAANISPYQLTGNSTAAVKKCCKDKGGRLEVDTGCSWQCQLGYFSENLRSLVLEDLTEWWLWCAQESISEGGPAMAYNDTHKDVVCRQVFNSLGGVSYPNPGAGKVVVYLSLVLSVVLSWYI
ncbi:hypothetical protein TWF281_003779 [Arthrobotrys megalospora]